MQVNKVNGEMQTQRLYIGTMRAHITIVRFNIIYF